MTFDHQSIERLKELGSQLPKEKSNTLPISSKKSNRSRNHKLHPVEIEDNPEKLFRELMKISPDGNIPSHLLDRLKEVESKAIKNSDDISENKKNPENTSTDDFQDLYITFKQLLLEE